MPDLIAQGSDETHRWRRTLPAGRAVVVGRESEWSAGWDPLLSRRHLEVCYHDGMLDVRRLREASNPLFFRGRSVDRATLQPGEHFVVGGTTFTLVDEHIAVTLDAPQPDVQETFTPADLKRLKFRDAHGRLDILGRLPELMAGGVDDGELFARLVNVLLVGIRHASTAALVAVDADHQGARVLHWDRRRLSGGTFAPSQRLIVDAVTRQQSLLHLWKSAGSSTDNTTSQYTVATQADWAFATPLSGEACHGWALYVEGRFGESAGLAAGDPAPLREDLKFAELVAAAVSAWRDNQQLRERHAGLRSFFSPPVLSAIARDDPQQVLAPREADVTVIFCDLEGFSRLSEQGAGDLLGLLNRVSRALGVATRQILELGGVVGDFHGDAVMGFWGWPLPQPNRAMLACQTALAIQAQNAAEARVTGEPSTLPRLGIGIASGRAMAGRIGTVDQAKVTVFGPVVNLAARLEGMTRLTGIDILVDEPTANAVRGESTLARVRRLANIRPSGLQTPLMVSQLLPPTGTTAELLQAAEYETALAAFTAGQWDDAREKLIKLPADDRAAQFLLRSMEEHHGQPPSDFDGVIRLTKK
ncbi:MAG: adenylate/guanylate cyclase domain-containing protein [Planctomycetia bacterium]|nr:adenylate/guanylate cyclase domain-containing protein [Planctomycetia bacterium]